MGLLRLLQVVLYRWSWNLQEMGSGGREFAGSYSRFIGTYSEVIRMTYAGRCVSRIRGYLLSFSESFVRTHLVTNNAIVSILTILHYLSLAW
jgi:hypothetical protein